MGVQKTYAEINEKIRSGKVAVVTAEEIIGLVEEKGIESVAREADVVTTDTFGHMLLNSEVIVENGGDIFIASATKRLISTFAGNSPFSNRLAIEIPADKTPLGICTSSGTVGPSLSLGKADAVVLAGSPALADAAASAVGNVVKTADIVNKGIVYMS